MQHLELEIAIISHIVPPQYHLIAHVSPAEMQLQAQQSYPLIRSYCELSLRTGDVVAIDKPSGLSDAGHPCFPETAPQSYIGVPFSVGGKVYGSINFSTRHTYSRHFDESDHEFMRMLARWCGTVLERAHADEELRLNEERLQRSQTFANIGTWDWNINNGSLFWSERIAPLFGYAPGKLETTYANFVAAIHPQDRANVLAAVDACVHQGTEYNIEHRVIWPDGSIHWLLEKGDVVRDENGAPMKMLGVVQDITQRRHYQEELARFRQVIDSSNQAIGIADLQGHLIYTNPAHSILLHDPERSLIGSDWQTLIPDHAQTMIDEIIHSLKNGQGWHGQLPIKTLSGKEFISYSNVDSVLDEHGNPCFVFNIFYDYSNELQRLEEIQQAREQAEHANRAKSDFLSSMSHELRTPLNAIIGFAQLLEKSRKDPLSERQLNYVHHILKSGRHLLVLINEILDLSKIEAGHVSVSLEAVEIQTLIEEACTLVTSMAHARGIEIQRLPPHTAPIFVRADRTRLRQVILNLLSNAIKYNCEHGYIRIQWQRYNKYTSGQYTSDQNTSDQYLRLTVSDTGNGISADDVPHLFQSFNRLSAENSDIEGTGVGLALSKKLMELMDGDIGYDHASAQGATFWITLPAVSSPEQDYPPTHPQNMEQHAPLSVHTQGADVHFLYIEDNPANLCLMKEIMQQWPEVELLNAPTAELGLVLAKERQPQVIILDINLPGMNGIEAIRALKNDPHTCTIPVIALSADATSHTIEKALNAGFDHYLCKPLDISELHQILHTFIPPRLTETDQPPGEQP
jgi:PAS domain S-box-containing protein